MNVLTQPRMWLERQDDGSVRLVVTEGVFSEASWADVQRWALNEANRRLRDGRQKEDT
jgi:hypothetical protein